MKQFLTIILSVALSLAAVYFLERPAAVTPAAAPTKESAYDRVMRTKTLRCGYALWPPYMLTKDVNTGKVGGIFAEIAEKVADGLHLKLEWAEEVGWSSYIESLRTGRFDVMCAPLWVSAEKAEFLNYTLPLTYSALHFYVRAGDTRFDDNLQKLNAPEYKLATMDGEVSQMTAKRFFPKAAELSIPELADITQLFMNVATGKADGVFNEPGLAKDYASKNPGTLRQVTKEPFQVFPNSMGMAIGENNLTRTIDSALTELMNSGEIDRIIAKYDPDRSIFMPVAKPYTYVPPPALP
ncbi:MAG: transporter substrate-binding domain-containing protein [Alphaproteobacteria bacterium]